MHFDGETRKAIYGEKHTDVAKTINNIGAIHRNLEQYQEALENFLQVLEINRILHGDYHISVAIVLSDIGGTYKSLFMYEEALTQYEEALQIRRILYGNEHPSIIRALYDIGKVYYVLHKYNEALASYEEALPIVKHLHGDYDDLVVICLGYIGNMNSKLTRYQEALVNYQEALLTNEVIYGEDHLYSAEILEDIGDIYDKLNDYLNALVSYLKASKILLINDKDNDDLSVRIAEVYIEFGNSYVGKKNFSKAIDQYNHALSHCSEDNDNHSSLIGEASSLIEEVEEQIKIILISDTKKYFGEESADTLDNLLEDIEIKDLLADFETSGSRHVITTLLGIVEPLTITTTNSIEITANHDNIDIAQVVHDGSLPIVERISSSALLTSDEAIHKRDGCVPALDELPTDHTIQAINTNPNYQPNQYIILASFTAKEAIESASTVKYALKEILYLPLPELPTPLKNNYLWVGIHYTVCNIGMYSITGKIDLVAPLKLTTIYGARILTYEHLAEQKQLALQNNKDNKIDSASEFIQNCGLDMLAQSVLAVLGGVVTGTPVIYDIIIGSAVGGTQCYFIYNQASKPAHTYSMSEQTTAWAADLIVGGVVMSNMHFNFDNPKEKMTAVKQGFVILSSVVTTDYITKMFLVNYKDSCFEYIANTIDSTYKYFVGENEAPEL